MVILRALFPKCVLGLACLLLCVALPAPALASASRFESCAQALPTLLELLSAHQAHQQARARQRDLQRTARRARRSAWLPTLRLTAEHRALSDIDKAQDAFEPLALRNRDGQTQVYRAQLRWELGRLFYHHAVSQALRLAHQLHRAQQSSRQHLARDFGKLQVLWLGACKEGWSLSAWEEALTLRAQVIARSGLNLPLPPRPTPGPSSQHEDRTQSPARR